MSCIVGILDRERVEPQPLRIRLRLGLDLGPVGDRGDLAAGVDYAAVDAQVRFLAVEGRFRLIESLAVAILRTVLLPPAPDERRAAVEHAAVHIAKPAVLREARPAVRLARDAAWARPGAAVEATIADLPEVRIRRRALAAGEVLEDGVALAIAGMRARIGAGHRFDQPATVLHVIRDISGPGPVPAGPPGR